MKTWKTVADVVPTRRELLRFGGLGLLGASAEMLAPWKAKAATSRKVTPRGSAKNVIFYEISGAISHIESFDFKESAGLPKDFQVEKLPTGIYFPTNQFPRIAKIMDKVAIQRSFVSHEEVHLRGQYYVQAGRPLNVAAASAVAVWARDQILGLKREREREREKVKVTCSRSR